MDIISLDISDNNHLVTGSIDNVICFWNSFNGTVTKSLNLEFVHAEKG